MRLLIIVILFFSWFNSRGQGIANSIEVLGADSLKFYFKSHGILVDKECSDFYRIAKVSHDGYFFHGHSKDYYSSGQLAVDCHYENNLMHGEYSSFYSNGQIKEKGRFNEGKKTGEWKYWYENGQLKKQIIFNGQYYFLDVLYKSNGKQLVVNGNGEFIDTDILPKTIMKGEIKEGKQHGKWMILNQVSGSKTAIEFFDNGKFIEGQNIAQVQSFSNKYSDYPNSLIDLTKDLLYESYSKKIDCMKYGPSSQYKMRRYNSQFTELPFYDYVYQNFDPQTLDTGYILAGFSIDQSGNLTKTSMHSTLGDKLVEEQLIAVLNSSDRWEPKTLNGKAIESTVLLVFQFYNGTYRILGDSRNGYPPVENNAQFNNGTEDFISLIESNANLPNRFLSKGFNLSASISFHVDENGNCVDDNSVFINRVKVTEDEQILYNALITMIKHTSEQWKPATYDGKPIKQHFNGVFTIRDGRPKFRLLSNNWVLK